MPKSSAVTLVHLPVPFCPAVSRILSTIGVPSSSLNAEDVARDLDEVAVEIAGVPLLEHLVHLVGRHAEQLFHDLVRLADQLHVAVLDPVVHHLHEVTGAVAADPVAARRAVLDLGGDRLEDRLDVRPRGRRAARHDRRPLERALFAARHAGADVEQAARLEILGAADAVGEVGVAAVDDDVALVEQRHQLVDQVVDRLAGLDHDHHPAR